MGIATDEDLLILERNIKRLTLLERAEAMRPMRQRNLEAMLPVTEGMKRSQLEIITAGSGGTSNA